MVAANLTQLLGTFITASHILHYNGLFDAYGHLSVRNPNNHSTFFMSRNEAPALISSASDIVEYYVSDASPVAADAPLGFIERYIHSETLKRFPGINSIVHSHSPAVIPFSMTGVPLRPSFSLAGFLGNDVPVFDIAKYYSKNDVQDTLVRTALLGAHLAAEFSNSSSAEYWPGHSLVLMQNHGLATCANNIQLATIQAIYAQMDATVQTTALTIHNANRGASTNNPISYLTKTQATEAWRTDIGMWERPWNLWKAQVRAEGENLYKNELDPVPKA